MKITRIDIIIYFIKILVENLYIYYFYNKISNNVIKSGNRINISILLSSVVIAGMCTYVRSQTISYLIIIIIYILYGGIIGVITKNKIGYSISITIISYALCSICLVTSIVLVFLLNKLVVIDNKFIQLLVILIIQFAILYKIFKIKRFKNGFGFLCKNLNNDFIDIIMINVSIAIVFIAWLLGTIFDDIQQIRRNLLISFIILGITMFIMIQKTLTMYYKQKLLEDTLEGYKKEIAEKDKEIAELKNEKFKISKITHEFFNRQKALELAVNSKKQGKELANRIKNLTEEYSTEITNMKINNKLQLTNIPEIDDMFSYMQKECIDNNIKFQLKIEGDIFYLIKNNISKNKLETLIGDHIRDAINAVRKNDVNEKEILVILGIKDDYYEFCVYDTGIEFEIDTLLKLGRERVTTNSENGGSGIGFITTFETMKQTGASLIIQEFNKKHFKYSKAVKIRFDNKNEYRIYSYRADKIIDNNNRIIIGELQKQFT